MKKIISTCLLVIWMGVIYYMSSQNGVSSSSLSNGLLYRIALFLSIKDIETFMINYGTIIRKLAHFGEYFILGLLMYITFRQYTRKPVFIVCLILCFLYATSDELHQLFIDDRCFSILDILLDTTGSFVAILFSHLIDRYVTKRKSD